MNLFSSVPFDAVLVSMTPPKTIHIAACFDHGFVMPTGVMMYSVCVNNPDVDIDFHLVVDESVNKKDKQEIMSTVSRFPGKCAIFYETSSQQYSNFPMNGNGKVTHATYFRLFLTEILPDSIEKVLYIDGDCIVRHSLLSLWNTDMEGYAIGAAYVKVLRGNEYYDRLGYPPSFGYFNAGVVLVNMSYWRRHSLVGVFANYLETHRNQIIWWDQDVLNATLYDKKKSIPIKYNMQTDCLNKDQTWGPWHSEDEIVEAVNDPVIIHYIFKDKPWISYSRPHHPYRSSFLKYQKQTVWRGRRQGRIPLSKRIRYFIGETLRKFGLRPSLESPFMEILPID